MRRRSLGRASIQGEGVLKVVKGMNRAKAPGPNGFSMAFFQDCWDVIKIRHHGGFY
jgi:hypothetical protein